MQVRKLEQTERERTWKLYEEAFPEDSARMRDFYYASRMRKNTVYVIENERGVEEMLHLNSCQARFGKEELTLSYIIAVATRQRYRQRDITRRILTEALREEYAAGKPFVFLEPANPVYYMSFQFTYTSRQEKRILKNDACCHCRMVDVGDESLLNELPTCYNAILAEKYDIFCLRSPDYLRRVCGEVSAGEGQVLSVREKQASDDEKLIGVEVFDYLGTREQGAHVVLPDTTILKCCSTEPFIMARILSLPAFFAGISLREEVTAEKREFFFSSKDPLVTENNDVFLLRATKRGSFVERLSAEMERRQHVTALTPEELVIVFFDVQHVPWVEELASYGAYFDEETWEADCRGGRGKR